MADKGQKEETSYVLSILTGTRDFIRDVGTPMAILVFAGLLYVGYLPSPILDAKQAAIDAKVAALKSTDDHTKMYHQDYLVLGVLRRICRNEAKLESDKDLCDDPGQAEPELERWGMMNPPPVNGLTQK